MTEKTQLEMDQETLVAYLDGELNEEVTVKVEQRLAAEPEFRKQLQELEQTWELLDELPNVELTEAFTRSTMEMAVYNEQRKVKKSRARWMWPSRALLFIGLPLLAYFATNSIANWQNQAPVRELVSNMPLYMNYELYESVGSIDFAEQLLDEGVFDSDFLDESDETSIAWEGSEAFLAQMSDERKADLRRKVNRFEQFPEESKDQFRSIHETLSQKENRDELLIKMTHYQTWLNQLDHTTTMELQKKSESERIEEIKATQRRLRRRFYGSNINTADKEIMFKWFESLAMENEAMLREEVRKLKLGARFRRLQSSGAPQDLLRILTNVRAQLVVDKLVTDEKFNELYESLTSSRARSLIDKQEEANRKRYVLLLNTWYVSDSDLRDFYSELSEAQHQQLDRVAPEKIREQLVRMYFETRFSRSTRNNR